ncbi:prolipoprotein diacylglyceryl transferase [Salmonella enterica subsp. enterica serovar Choleraesuis str. 0006]|nr:prolipoprotein diacylglyceryl transferase [Salmonella enterica subsp. enterica serovar Choleraesuis str. 0006]
MTSSYLHFPDFDPVIFSIGPVALHWYGLMYLVGFVFAMWLAVRRANRPGSGWTKTKLKIYSMQVSWGSSWGDVLAMSCL